jgi:hypothetical protein
MLTTDDIVSRSSNGNSKTMLYPNTVFIVTFGTELVPKMAKLVPKQTIIFHV